MFVRKRLKINEKEAGMAHFFKESNVVVLNEPCNRKVLEQTLTSTSPKRQRRHPMTNIVKHFCRN